MPDPRDGLDVARVPGAGESPTEGTGRRQESEPQRTILLERGNGAPDPVFAWLIRLDGPQAGHAEQLQEEETRIGRDPARVHFLLADPTVSALHAKIARRVDAEGRAHYTLYDLGSANGTWVEGAEIFESPLQDGTRMILGKSELLFKCL